MFNERRIFMIISGFFVSATTLVDWYINALNRIQLFSKDELYRYEMFLERPRRVLSPPDLAYDWWTAILVAVVMFFLGYMLANIVVGIFQSRFILINNVYLKIFAMAGLILGLCAGFLLFASAFTFPLIWKIYLSIVIALLTFLGTYLVLRSPYHMYFWWKQKRSCT